MTKRPSAVVVADVNWFSTANLFREVDDPDVTLLALRCMDYRNAWRNGFRPWSRSARLHRETKGRWVRDLALPPGWMKRFPRLGMRPIARAARRFWSRQGTGRSRALIATYPHYDHLIEQSRPERSLYYNLDDYALYWPDRADEVRAMERRIVARADATICVARQRADELREALPEFASRIHHVPHGAPSTFLAPCPLHAPGAPPPGLAGLPRPLLGYVGTLEDRLDWDLLESLADRFPGGSLVFLGRPPSPTDASWYAACRRLLDRPNVHAVGWRPQAELPAYYQAFDVVLIPYRVDHPFNVACSPTKIMDGLASSRPIVATDLPECRLYADLFDVAPSREAFVEAVARIVATGSDDGRAQSRREWADSHSCAKVAARVLEILAGAYA